MSTSIDNTTLVKLVGGNSRFAFDLYHALKGQQTNLFFSPHSISTALAMTYAGARNETENQMAEALHFALPQDQLHPAFHSLARELDQRGKRFDQENDDGFRLNMVNQLWGQAGYKFLARFLNLLTQNYGAVLQLVDFADNPEVARSIINQWVSDQTKGRIKDLLSPGVINSLTRLVLTNAIYFKASWATPFSEQATRQKPFFLLDGSQISVSMMHQNTSLGYAHAENYQVVELPYLGWGFSMVVLLPAAGAFAAVESALNAASVNAALQKVTYQEIRLAMPKFELELGINLGSILTALGMPAAFTAGADFSGMNGTLELYISEVIHKAFVSVDEAGTEAAAATAVVMALKMAMEQPLEVTIDRPFIFLIRDTQTGAILFMGRVLDPTA